jgi:hypothetical protein
VTTTALATVTNVSPPKITVDGDTVQVPLMLLTGQTVALHARVRVEIRGGGLRPVLAS